MTYQSNDKMGIEAFKKLESDPKINKERYVDGDYDILGAKYISKKIQA